MTSSSPASLAKLKHALLWRWQGLLYKARLGQALYCLSRPFNGKGASHNLKHPLVVSLTSYPPRYATLALTLKSLLRQSLRADHVILWIAQADLGSLPESVQALQAEGLEIRATDDLKSYKKILPALDAFPNAYIVTADDDVYYWPTWLAELVEGLTPDDKTITCHRAHRITFNADGSFKPYASWHWNIRERAVSKEIFPTGVGGVLYPPGSLTHTRDDRTATRRDCPTGDDIWLYWMGRRNGMRYKTVGCFRDMLLWHGSQETALWDENLLKGNNDRQIRAIVTVYGYPDTR